MINIISTVVHCVTTLYYILFLSRFFKPSYFTLSKNGFTVWNGILTLSKGFMRQHGRLYLIGGAEMLLFKILELNHNQKKKKKIK